MERMYTMRVNTILESMYPNYDIVNPPTTMELIEKTHRELFNFEYPWYTDDVTTKDNFEIMFCARYLMDQIGVETVSMFRHFIWATLFANAEKYRQLFKSLVDYDLLYTFEETETENGDNTTTETEHSEQDTTQDKNITSEQTKAGTVESSVDSAQNQTDNVTSNTTEGITASQDSNTTKNSQGLKSDTPQINFSENDYASELTRDQGTDAVTDESSSDTTTEGTSKLVRENSVNGTTTDTDNTTITNIGADKTTGNVTGDKSKNVSNEHKISRTRKGFSGDRSDLIIKYRQTILNINKMIVDDCKNLFMGVW